jgi:U-box domain
MVDPVVLVGDQHTYERAAIEAWLAAHGVSPVTGHPLSSKDIVPNHMLRGLIGNKMAMLSS